MPRYEILQWPNQMLKPTSFKILTGFKLRSTSATTSRTLLALRLLTASCSKYQLQSLWLNWTGSLFLMIIPQWILTLRFQYLVVRRENAGAAAVLQRSICTVMTRAGPCELCGSLLARLRGQATVATTVVKGSWNGGRVKKEDFKYFSHTVLLLYNSTALFTT